MDVKNVCRTAAILVLMGGMAFAGVLGSAYAQSETTVVGQNDPDVDVQAVQVAVNNYDIVNLVGTLHFGDDADPYTGPGAYLNRGGVLIAEPHVTLRGEGMDVTVIKGGGLLWPEEEEFASPIVVRADDFRIRDLTLDGPLGVGIGVQGCEDFESTRVGIVNAVVHPGTTIGWNVNFCSGEIRIQEGRCSNVSSGGGWLDHAVNAVFGNVNAHFMILDNTLETAATMYAVAVQLGEFNGGPNSVVIRGNTVVASAPVISSAITVFVSGDALIEHNEVTSSSETFCFGIHCQTRTHADVVGPTASYLIQKNRIHMGDGVLSAAFGGGWSLYPGGPFDGGVVRNNKCTGQADFGMFVEEGQDNVFLGNNLATLDAPSTYYLGENTSGNQVRGHSGGCAVVDLGTDNSITGCTPMADAGGIGPQLSEMLTEGMWPSNLPGLSSNPAPSEAARPVPLPSHSTWGQIKRQR